MSIKLAFTILALVHYSSSSMQPSALNSDQSTYQTVSDLETSSSIPTTLLLQQTQSDHNKSILQLPHHVPAQSLEEDEPLLIAEQEDISEELTTITAPTTRFPITIQNYVTEGVAAPKADPLHSSLIIKSLYQEISSEESSIKNLTTSSSEDELENFVFNETLARETTEEDNRNEASEEVSVTESIITSTLTTTTAGTTKRRIPELSRQKQAKHIKKLRAPADEVLRIFLEDSYLRSPLAVLVDTSPEALRKTKILWNATLTEATSIDMALVSFDSTGIRATYNFKNTRTLVAGLNSIQKTTSTHLNEKTFWSILKASELIPYDSAIFLFTDSIPSDSEMAQVAAITLLKKRIRLYLFWFGGGAPTSLDGTDTEIVGGKPAAGDGLLGDVALRTGGEIIYMTKEAINSSSGDIGLVTLLLQNNLQGVNQLFQQPPQKIEHNAYHQRTNTKKTGSSSKQETSSLDEVELADGHEEHGEEERTNASDEEEISLTTTVTTGADVEIMFDDDVAESRRSEDLIRFLDNEHQTSVLMNDEIDETESTLDSEVEITDLDGNSRQLAANIESNTLVTISPQSKLTSNPGSQAMIYFEVTNLRNVASYHTFIVLDEQRFVRQTNPPIGLWIAPGQTSTVTVILFVPQTAEAGTRNKVTFTSRSVSEVIQSVYFTVAGQNTVQDSSAPYIYYTYGSRCEWKTSPGTCSQHVWSVEITAQDWESGVLRVQSQPRGLLLRNVFTAGTREPVTATYSASCCQPRVTITAFDLANNQKTLTLDVTDIWLSEAAIAAIVLGVILFICLVILIVVFCIWCCKRRKASQELPIYRSRARADNN